MKVEVAVLAPVPNISLHVSVDVKQRFNIRKLSLKKKKSENLVFNVSKFATGQTIQN